MGHTGRHTTEQGEVTAAEQARPAALQNPCGPGSQTHTREVPQTTLQAALRQRPTLQDIEKAEGIKDKLKISQSK